MQLKTNLTAIVILATTLHGIEAKNEYGIYKIPTPQTTYSSKEKRESVCKSFGESYKVPNIEELFNVPDELREKGEKSLYASSTTNKENSDEIYYYSFENRDVNIVSQKESLYLVCIKPTQNIKTKNLIWSKGERNKMNYQEAKAFCKAKGERLPSASELFSLALEKLRDEEGFKLKYGFTYPKYYWSGDANDDFSNTAIVVGFMRASVANSSKENKSFVRCVKDAK